MSKTQAERIHARRRAYERHDLTLSRDDLRGLARKIQREDGEFVQRESRRVTIWRVVYRDRRLKVVYDKHRKNVVTFLHR